MTSSIASNSKCYVGFINKEPVAFVGIGKFPHPTNKNIYKVGRVVVLPHWQGYNIGMKMVEHIVDKYYQENDVRITTTLPIVHNYLWRSNKWELTFQGIRKSEDAGKSSQMSKTPRECYLETYQFKNKQCIVNKPSRVRCPIEKIKIDKPQEKEEVFVGFRKIEASNK